MTCQPAARYGWQIFYAKGLTKKLIGHFLSLCTLPAIPKFLKR